MSSAARSLACRATELALALALVAAASLAVGWSVPAGLLGLAAAAAGVVGARAAQRHGRTAEHAARELTAALELARADTAAVRTALGAQRARGARATEQGEERQALLDALADGAPIGIFCLDGRRWTFANARLAEISGLTPAELLEGRLWTLVHPEDRLQLEVDHRPLDDGSTAGLPGGLVGGYYRLVRPDGEERWIHLRLSGIDGPGRTYLGTVEDTTNEVTARQHTSLLATVVAGTTDMVAITAPDGQVRFLNPAGRQLVDLERGADLGQLHVSRLFSAPGWRRLSEIAIPAATAHGSWSGDAEVLTGDGTMRPVSLVVVAHRDAVGRIDRLSLLARDTAGRAPEQAALGRVASHDQLTGLPNRTSFVHSLTQALATASHSDRGVAVLLVDVDRFKAINDDLGHAAGDQVLKQVALRLSGVLRSGDVAARVGGDEFLILATDVDDEVAALMVAERIREVLQTPFALEGPARHELRLSASVGVATSQVDDSPTTLIGRADEATTRAKALGKDRVQLHDDSARRRVRSSLLAEQALRVAIEDGQLELRYQPVIDLRDGRVLGSEALVRWAHPELGVLAPHDFIELAEETGLIRPLGAWVMAEAVRQAGRWAEDLSMPPGLRLSVNLSAQQLVDGDLADRTAAMLRAMALAPDTLCVELTERALATDEDLARAELHAFRELGVRVAVDDFGTGYSSLAQLRRFPVDILKLDAGFVAGLGSNPADTAIVATVQGLADALGLATIAEGVETGGQLDTLRDIGCASAQGYLFSRPLTAAAFTAFARGREVDLRSAGPGPADHDVHLGRDVPQDARAGSEHPLHH